MPDYSHASKTPLIALEDQHKYVLRRESEIVQGLKLLSKKPEILTAYFDGEENFLLTTVVDVLRREGLLILDLGPNEGMNRKAERAERFIFAGRQGGVDVRFDTGPLQRIDYQGIPSWSTNLPKSMLRLQRREYFRVPAPVARPVLCRIPAPGVRDWTCRVVDISLGGIGMIDLELEVRLKPFQVLNGCEVTIPDFGSFKADLEVRSICRTLRKGGRPARRIGLAFARFPRSKEALIQRYINHLQLKERELAGS